MLKIVCSVLYIYAIAGVIYNMYSKDLQWVFEPNGRKMWNIKVVLDILAHMASAIILWPILARANYIERKAKKAHG